MDDEQNAGSVTASPRRAAVDPAMPDRNCGPLTAPRPGEALTATRIGAVNGTVAAALVGVACAMPWAIGALVFQGSVSWQSALARWALLLATAVAVASAVIVGASSLWFARFGGRRDAAAEALPQAYRYLAAPDFDARAGALLRRAQDAIDRVRSSEVCQAGLLDRAAFGTALAAQEREIALALRQQSLLRHARAELPVVAEKSAASHLLDRQYEAAHLADQSIVSRIGALEQLAAEVCRADDAYRDRRALAAVSELADQHLDMLARTAADSHGIAEIAVLSQQASAVHLALRDLPPV